MAISRRLLLSLPALAAARAAEPSPESMLDELRRAQRSPAISAAVWKRGTVVWSLAFGQADVENEIAAVPESRFRIGSLSKLLTAAAAARLIEAGALDPDAPIQRYVPEFPEKPEGKITPRLLLGHLAGIRHYGNAEYINRQTYRSLKEPLKAILDAPLLHAPGTKYFYSSYGFNLLGAAIETASGQDFLTAIRQQVTGPLKLNSMVADQNASVIPRRVRFYSLSGDTLENGPYTDLSDRWPSGGFLSTASDLASFGGAHLTGNFLKPETLRQMFTSQKTSDGKETGTGWAWRVGQLNGRRVVHHGGDSIGGRAFLLLRPDDGVAVAILANLSLARFAETQAMGLADRFA